MTDVSSNSYHAVNPYNFIPLEEQPARAPLTDYYPDAKALKSGWLTVQIKATTPLIIPDGSKYHYKSLGKDCEHKSYAFFKLPDGKYGIPGSSLRGMLRSLYEAVSNSCMPLLPDDPRSPLSQRTPLYAAFHKRGILEYDADNKLWKLWKARAYKKTVSYRDVEHGTYQSYNNAARVWFVPEEHKDSTEPRSFRFVSPNGQGAQQGLLQFSIPVNSTRDYHVAVLVKAEEAPEREWGDTQIPSAAQSGRDVYNSLHGSVRDTVDNIQKIRENLKRNNPAVAKKIEQDPIPQQDLLNQMQQMQASGGQVPVYYMTVKRGADTLYYLSGSAAGRVQQHRSWGEIMGAYAPCASLDQLCPACALFGTAKGTKGRLRFTDAMQTTTYTPRPYSLPILGEPRTSSFEFYLRRPESPSDAEKVTYWNFDFYSVKYKDGHTEYYDLSAATPRGRKMYWHSEPVSGEYSMSCMNDTMEVMPSGAEFKAQIFFDRITEQQLQDLIWVITLGDNCKDSRMQQKLGHAKPLGYGSVKLTVTDVCQRILCEDLSMEPCPIEVPKKPEPFSAVKGYRIDTKSVPVRSLLKMCNIDAVKSTPVHYLYQSVTRKDSSKTPPQIYTWFSENRKNAALLKTLPEPLDEKLWLPSAKPPDVSLYKNKGADEKKQEPTGANAPRSPCKAEASHAGGASWPNPGDRVTGKVTKVSDNGFHASTESEGICFVYFKNIPGCRHGAVSQFVTVDQTVCLEFMGTDEQGRKNFKMVE